jgi:hypothetical protein
VRWFTTSPSAPAGRERHGNRALAEARVAHARASRTGSGLNNKGFARSTLSGRACRPPPPALGEARTGEQR